MHTISDTEFNQFQRFIFDAAGITLGSAKKALVCGRLAKRLSACGVASYTAYLKLLKSGEAPAEMQTAVDLLTTNETYFFREPKHFELLGKMEMKAAGRTQPSSRGHRRWGRKRLRIKQGGKRRDRSGHSFATSPDRRHTSATPSFRNCR